MIPPQPGWYRDATPGQLRWWDGRGWTGHVYPLPPALASGAPALFPGLPLAATAKTPPALDRTVAEMKEQDPRPWGAKPVVVPLVAIVAIILGSMVLSPRLSALSTSARLPVGIGINVAIEVLQVAAIYLAGRSIARRVGGWGRAFGWRRPRWRDLLAALAGVATAFGARVVFVVVMQLASGGQAAKQAQNIELTSDSLVVIIAMVLLTVVSAPLTEELVFRGMLLRTFMRRLSFWPAALVSTVIFGAFHAYEVGTVLGAVTLSIAVGIMGLVNCIINRYTDSLVGGIYCHALLNGLAMTILLITH